MRLAALAAIAVILISTDAFAWRQSASCIRSDQVDPLAPTSAPRCGANERPIRFLRPDLETSFSVSNEGNQNVTSGVAVETIVSAVTSWNEPDCSEFSFVEVSDAPDGPDFTDEQNWIGFVETWPHSAVAVAVTSVTTDENGVIVDTDMELNAETVEIGIVDESTTGALFDLANIVTHEAGHMLGLDHSAVAEATMQFETPFLETAKRTLNPDDIEGLCTLYPEEIEIPMPEEDDGCCATSGHKRTDQLWLVLILFGYIYRRRNKTCVCLLNRLLESILGAWTTISRVKKPNSSLNQKIRVNEVV